MRFLMIFWVSWFFHLSGAFAGSSSDLDKISLGQEIATVESSPEEPIVDNNAATAFPLENAAATEPLETSAEDINPKSPAPVVTAAPIDETDLAEPTVSLKKDDGAKLLPAKSITKLSDQELRDLCESLREPNPQTMDAIKGASLQNFRQTEPLILRVDRMKTLRNLQAKYVVLVDGKTLETPTKKTSLKKTAKVDFLRDIKKPHLFCGVSAGRIQGISDQLIFVGVKAPVALRKHPQVRIVKAL